MGDTWSIQLDRLDVLDADEDGFLSDGDEPYLIMLGFRSRPRTAGSTHVTWSGVLDDSWANGIDSGGTAGIPPAMGRVEFNDVDLPDVAAIAAGRMPELLGALAIVMESDATPFDAVRAEVDKLRLAAEDALRRLVEDGNLDPADPTTAIRQAVQGVAAQMAPSLQEKLMLFLSSWGDPDDLVGTPLFAFAAVDPSVALPGQLPGLAEQPIGAEVGSNGVRYRVSGRVARSGWRGFELSPGGAASTQADMAVLSRVPNSMELFHIGADGAVRDRFWYDGDQWKGFDLAPPGSASATGGIAGVSRVPNSMEVFFIGADGSMQDRFWYDGDQWKGFELAPAGSASATGAVTAVSRVPNSMEVWWIAPDGSVQAAYWYEGAQWQRYTLAPAGAAAVTGAVAAVSRVPTSMEVWFTGANGSVQDRFWYEGSTWQGFELAPAGSASPTGGIAAVSRIPNSMEVWFTAPNGSVQDRFWYDGSTWQGFELAGPGAATPNGGIAAVSRVPNSMEIWFAAPNGAVQDRFTYL